MPELLLGGNGTREVRLDTRSFNRHGLISGATGTGKTVTLQVLAEQLAEHGVPVFVTDIKGDLAGLAEAGTGHVKVTERLQYIGIAEHTFKAMPVTFWDVSGLAGHPLRTTISEMGPLLLAHLLDLNEAQTGALYACFREADTRGWLLLDLDDLNSMLTHIGESAKELRPTYGNISPATIGAIKRRLLILEEQGLAEFLGEPALELHDFFTRASRPGEPETGMINILDVTRLVQQSPRLYGTVLIWLLAELFEQLPEVGDLDKPRFVIFLDEAHLLFEGAMPGLIEKIEQVARLIRSKGVGVFFITQSPLDIPAAVAGQLGLKIQHALRAFTPRDQKTLKTVAETFRPNPAFSTLEVLPELGTGEALVSGLDAKGRPQPVERTLIVPPMTKIGPIDAATRRELLDASPMAGRYDRKVNRQSAHELLQQRLEREAKTTEPETQTRPRAGSRRQTTSEAFIKSVTRALGSQLGRQIARGILGSIFKK